MNYMGSFCMQISILCHTNHQEVIVVVNKNMNDSLAQKEAKEQNRNLRNKNISGDKHLTGPNHPST
jgi:hypothetical protein